VVLGFLAFAIAKNPAGLICAIVSGMLMVPVAAIFHCSTGWRRLVMALYTSVPAAVAVGGVVLTAVTYKGMDSGLFTGPAAVTTAIVIVGAATSTWLALPLSRGS
jgi:hypothetical protein